VGHLALRAIQLFIAYSAVLAAVVVAGYLGAAVGIWASIVWGCGLALAIAAYVKRRAAAKGSG
jgi:hypothetical protein